MVIHHLKAIKSIGKMELYHGIEWKTLEKMEEFYQIPYNM